MLDTTAPLGETAEQMMQGDPTAQFTVTRALDVLVPFHDRVVVLPDAPEEMIGSFYVPDTAQQRPARGVVVAVGPLVSPGVRVGQRVLYGHYTGLEAQHGRATVLLMREADLFAAIYPAADGVPADARNVQFIDVTPSS